MTEGNVNTEKPGQSSGDTSKARRYHYGYAGAPTPPPPAKPAASVADLPALTPAESSVWPTVPTYVWPLLAACTILLGILYRANFKNLIKDYWWSDPSWSHGFAVPVLSGVLIYLQWDKFAGLKPKTSLIGLLLLIYGIATQVLFRMSGQSHMANLSLLTVLFGGVLWVLGWDYMKVLWLPIVYLLFMIPPPTALYVKLTTPMQFLAANAGVAFLPLFGVHAMREGTIIQVPVGSEWHKLNVEEACSGIRMLMAFLALAVALAYTQVRPMWQKVTLALCAAPVAVLCNALRVTLTGVLYVTAGPKWAEGSVHEYLGFFMLIPAMGMQLALGWVLDHIYLDEPASEVIAKVNAATPRQADQPRHAWGPSLGVVTAVLITGLVGMEVAKGLGHVVIDKPPAPLAIPLQELPKTLGPVEYSDAKGAPIFTAKYKAGPKDQTLPPEQVKTLGTEDYLLRDYGNIAKDPRADVGGVLFLNLNYYATGSATPHVPKFCWAGAGLKLQDERRIVVKGVHHKDGTVSDVPMTLLSFGVRPEGSDDPLLNESVLGSSDMYKNVAYTFHVNGEYVATPNEVSKRFWRAQAKYAYHCKVEITVPKPCSSQEAEPAIADFLRASLAEIEKCLPDAASLQAAEAAREKPISTTR